MKIALNVHHDHIGQAQGVVGKSGCESFFIEDTAPDQGRHFRVFGFHRRNAAVQVVNLPIGAGGGPLHADDEFVWLAGGVISGIGDNPGH